MSKHTALFERAKKIIPGGVNSPVRAFQAVGGTPLFFQSGKGAKITDVTGKSYLDLVGSWGPLILGHAHPKVIAALSETLQDGTSFGAPIESEILLAEKICAFFPGIEKVRLVNSGTEATMSAIRLARAHTKRDFIIKFSGCYHGHADPLLVAAGSGALTLGKPNSEGVPEHAVQDTLVLNYNDLAGVKEAFEKYPHQIAAIIVEPIAGNMGCVLPKENFLEGLKEITAKHQSLLIFDEVMTGFRLARGGAQERLAVQADITCLGKIIGGGLPVGAYGASKEIMAQVAPEGGMYQAGTLSGNPLAVAAGLATLRELEKPGFYEALEENCRFFYQRLEENLNGLSFPVTLNRIGSMFCLYFHPGPIEDFETVLQSESAKYAAFFHGLLENGVYMAPSAFECGFISSAHSREDLGIIADKMVSVLKTL